MQHNSILQRELFSIWDTFEPTLFFPYISYK